MCLSAYITEGDEVHEIESQGGLAALVEDGECAMLPGYAYRAGDCLCGVDVYRTLVPEGYTVEQDECGDYRAERTPC